MEYMDSINITPMPIPKFMDKVDVLIQLHEGGVRVCSVAVLRYFWCDFAIIFLLTHSITASKH